MASYILYTYQFAPLSGNEQKLFEAVPSAAERMERKQDYLQQILADANLHFFKGQREKIFKHQIRYNTDGIVILKIANRKPLRYETDFKMKEQENSPSCFVIIDNRHNIQRIAIEENITAFSGTEVVKNIIENSLQKHLKSYGLTISIQREYQKNEFWQLIKRHPEGIAMVRFHFSYPNLPRVCESINQLISNQSRLTNSKDTTFELKSSSSEQLALSSDNEQLNGLVEASADSGNLITLRIKGYRKHITTGKTTRKIEIADLEAQITKNQVEADLASVVKILNDVK